MIRSKYVIKLIYTKRSYKELDKKYFRTLEKPSWPHNNDVIEVLNHEKSQSNSFKFLEDDIIDTELVLYNIGFSPRMTQMQMIKDLGTVFDKMKEFEECHDDHKIIIKFNNPKDTFEGFKKGKEFYFFNGFVSVIYNRKPTSNYRPAPYQFQRQSRARSRSPLRREETNGNQWKYPSSRPSFVNENESR